MKIKAKLRCFWRHNNRMVGMWAVAFQVLLILIPPHNIGDIILVAVTIAWQLVWIFERRADTLRRKNRIITHKYIRELNDHYKDLRRHIKCEEERHELLKRLIELKEQTEQTE